MNFDVIAMSTPSIHKELPKVIANSSYEVVIIDCPQEQRKKASAL
ncbi:hypothetical protein [Acidipila sp. EB88]